MFKHFVGLPELQRTPLAPPARGAASAEKPTAPLLSLHRRTLFLQVPKIALFDLSREHSSFK